MSDHALDRERLMSEIRARHPRFRTAVLSDARVVSANRGKPLAGVGRRGVAREAMRLAWESDSFLGQVMYRAKARLQALGVPIVPRIFHRLAMVLSGICIGDPVVVREGAHLAHGQIVIDGVVEIGKGATIFPFVTIGRTAKSIAGPSIGPGVTIGSGAKLIGPITIGAGARIGANALVVSDVEAGAKVIAPVASELSEAADSPGLTGG